ncbi:MAG TPA: hypothetical protein VE077_22900 [Candidatus Methylomirabilis sp.]|nr:hypothetical protein [Candidatus Methylomirabilis sp.]
MTETRKHVLLWVKQEFLQSPGMLQILKETGIFSHPEEKWRELAEAAEVTGGFALSGKLVNCDHPAGVWISPPSGRGLEVLVPWHFVISLVTAEEPQSSKTFGLIIDEAERNALKKMP